MTADKDLYVQPLHGAHNKVLRTEKDNEIAQHTRAKVAAIAVAAGVSRTEIAKLLGVDRSTVSRWVTDAKTAGEGSDD